LIIWLLELAAAVAVTALVAAVAVADCAAQSQQQAVADH
jgi:hypothetical protein